MKKGLIFLKTVLLCGVMGKTVQARDHLLNLERWSVQGSDTIMLFSVIILLVLGCAVYITTTNLTGEARESGCSRLSISLQLLSTFLTIFLLIGGLYFFDIVSKLRGVSGVLLTFGGSAAIFGMACGFLLLGNYLYEHPEKLRKRGV